MPKKYCLRINNPDGIEIDMDKLNGFVNKLYITKSKDKDPKSAKAMAKKVGKAFADKYALAESAGVSIAKTLQDWAKFD